jgi:hypothetical protein
MDSGLMDSGLMDSGLMLTNYMYPESPSTWQEKLLKRYDSRQGIAKPVY